MGQHAILITLMIGVKTEDAACRMQEIYKKIIIPAGKLGVLITLCPVHSNYFNEFITDINGMKVSYRLDGDSRPPKGFTITHLLKSASLIDSKVDYLIYCDGSGRIPFEQCLTILKELQKKEVPCILANRVPWRSGISEPRKIIEEFESWIVCNKFNIKEIPDLQCGLWGFLYPEYSKINIDCVGYEIELNIACEIFKHIKKVGIINVKTTEEGTTKSLFSGDNYSKISQHFQKAYFLYKYFGFNNKKDTLVKLAKQYNSIALESRRLPNEYLKMLEIIDGDIPQPTIIHIN